MADLRPTHGQNPFDVQWNTYEAVAHNVDGTLLPSGIVGYPADATKFLNGLGAWTVPSGGGASEWPATALTVFVDYANGSDSNTGLSPSDALQTIQAAYSSLELEAGANYTADSSGNLGVGRIHLLPGNHDVGSGFTGDPRKTVEFLGTTSGFRWHATANSAARIVSSSNPASFIDVTDNSHVARGFTFRDVAFLVSTSTNSSTTACIKYAGDNLTVERCVFDTVSGINTTTLVAILQAAAPNTDNAWAHIQYNDCARMGLYQAATGINFNRTVIMSNQVFYDGGGSIPMIWGQGDLQFCTVAFNNLEGGAVAVQLDSSSADRNLFLNNAGEDNTAGTNPYYSFTGSNQYNLIVGGSVHRSGSGAGINGIFAQFAANAHSNTVWGPFNTQGQTGYKQRIVDNSTLGNNLINPDGTQLRYTAGSGAV